MASMKTMMMVALDVAPSMGEPVSASVGLNEKRVAKVELAKNFVSLFILQRAMASKTAEFGMITFGSGETNNYLNGTQGGYEGIDEVVPMEKPSKLTFQAIHNIGVGVENIDLIDAIVVSQDVLMRVNANKAYNRIMLLITDGETEVQGVDDLEAIVEQMKTVKNFGLYVAMMGRVTEDSSIVKKENAKLLQSLADSVNGRFIEVANLGDSIHLLTGGLGLGTRPTLSKTVLEITSSLRIPCVYWSKVSKVSPPSLKKEPKPAEDEDNEEEEMEVEEAGAIKRDITYRVPGNEDVEIGLEERVKGYRYGGQYIPVTPADEENFKIPGSPVIHVIGCIKKAKIPRHHFLDPPSYVHPNLDSEPAQYLFGAFVQGLLTEDKVCLARLVKRENSDPALVALLPVLDQTMSFLMYRIPFSDDIREYNFPSLVAFASEKLIAKNPVLQQQRQAMSAYIESLTVPVITKSVVTPVNPALQSIYASIHQKLLHVSDSEKIYVPDFTTLTNDPEKQRVIEAVYSAFPLVKVEKKSKRKKVFWSDVDTTATTTTATATVEGTTGANATSVAEEVPATGGGPAKKAKFEINVNQIAAAIAAPVNPTGASASARTAAPAPSNSSSTATTSNIVVKQEPVSVPAVKAEATEDDEDEDDLNLPDFTTGSVTPVEDFKAHIEAIRAANPANKKVRINKAMKIMTKIIQRNVALGGSRTHYKRAVSCLKELRDVSVKEKEFELFNSYLQTFKTNYQKGRHALAWQLATDELLTLISKDEVKSSNVTDDEAEQFLADIDNEGREDEEDDEEGVV